MGQAIATKELGVSPGFFASLMLMFESRFVVLFELFLLKISSMAS